MTDIVNDVKNVGSTFTSWDSCMSKAYCKWPVVAAIIVGSLIALSVLWCIFSCLCCGVSLCAACGKCLTCGGCCGACSNGGRRRKDPEYQPMPPTPYQGYQPQPFPMMYNNGPQFATFDAGNKRDIRIHDDSLPPMPSWETAQTHRVEDRTQQRGSEMEMERMLPQSPQRGPMSPRREQPRVQSQPYASDLGAQRMDQHQGYNNDYYDPPQQPLSPAPTYYSTVPAAAVGAMQSSNRDNLSPQQNHYHSSFETGYTPNATPYPSSRESIQFAAQRSMSPPSAPIYDMYRSSTLEQSQGARPANMLQIGRKPVAGSSREV